MSASRTRLLTVTTALLLGAAACSAPATPDEALLRDLEQATAAGIELAPKTGGTAVVSAVERTGTRPQPSAAPRKRTRAPAPRVEPRPEAPPAPAPTVARTEEPLPQPAPAVMRPQSRPTPTPNCPGGCRSVSDVIRDAPFPIKP